MPHERTTSQDDRVRRADRFRRGGAPHRAMEVLHEVFLDGRVGLEAMLLLAHCLADRGEHAGARSIYEDLISRAPRLALPWLGVVHGHVRQGRLDRALETLDRWIDRDPDQVRAHRLRGRYLHRLGRPGEAVRAYEEARRRTPADRALLHEIARFYQDTDDPAGSIPLIEQILARDPDDRSAWWDLYRAAQRLGRVRVAARAGRDLVRLGEGSPGFPVDVARLCLKAGDRNAAALLLEDHVTVQPGDRRAWLLKAANHEDLGETAEATVAYEAALRLDPSAPEPLWGLVRLCRRTRDPAGERTWLHRLVLLTPHDPRALVLGARSDRDCGCSEQAVAALERALLLRPDHPVILRELAIAHLGSPAPAGALPVVFRYLEQRPEDPEMNYRLGLLLLQTADREGAEQAFHQSVQHDPDGHSGRLAAYELRVLAGTFAPARPALLLRGPRTAGRLVGVHP